MSITNTNERQYPLSAVLDLGIAQIGVGAEVRFRVPPGAILTGLAVQTVVAFNSATTATLSISDGATTFAAAVDVRTVGAEVVANLAAFYPSGGTLTISMAQTGAAATVGRVIVVATYQVLNRVNEVQG